MEQHAISSDLIRGHIDTIILHTLIDGDKFAQQISDAVEEKSEKEYKINQATLYSSLKRLETLKYVVSYWNDSDGGGRRKFFKLTDVGKDFVQNNTDNWSVSRAIIDKLMNCSPQPIYQTQVVEKVVEKIVEVPVEKIIEKPVVVEEKPVSSESTPLVTQQTATRQADTSSQEINFRNILNGLIKANSVPKTENTELEPIIKAETEPESEQEVEKFNAAIIENDYSIHRSNSGKIDFSDLALKAAKEGYKIRISAKDSHVSAGTLLINKLNLFVALTIFLVSMLEFLVFSSLYPSVLKLSAVSVILVLAVFAILPITRLIYYKKDPNKTVNKSISTDSVLTSAIIVFNLLLINLALTLLFDMDYQKIFNVVYFVVVPITLYLDIFIYYVVRYFVGKSDICRLKKKARC